MLLRDSVVNQNYLEKVVRVLHPNENIHINNLNEIKNPTTGKQLEVDVWVPSLQLCFEFQDIYHYSTIYYARSSLQVIQSRDDLKKHTLQKREETLIIVPYWWDGDKKSLIATINFQRPDLAMGSLAPPISFNPLYHEKINAVPEIGELMLAGFLEYLFLSSIDGTFWWVGEKYDGIRFCWHPSNQIVYSRNGIPLSVTPNLTKEFGNTFIDGEFWSGRGLFLEAFQLAQPQPQLNIALSRFIAFDIPSGTLRNKQFERRYAVLMHHIPSHHPVLVVPGRISCCSKDFLVSLLHEVLENGGEGVILYKFSSKYESGRSTLLYKIKTTTRIDEEALVVKSTPTHIRLQLPSGDNFKVPPTNTSSLISKISKGDVVTFSCSKHTQHHIPLDPLIARVRRDITWEQVLAKYNISKVKAKRKAPEYSFPVSDQGIRSFFEKFAKDRNFDPLLASNWYKISRKQVLMESNGETLLKKYRSSFVHALMAAFPQIGLDSSRFLNVPANFWHDKRNQRKEVMNLATRAGFDPLIAENWYLWNPIMARELHKSPVLTYYSGNRTKAIHHLFPDIGLKEKLFSKVLSKNAIREKLTEFAISKQVDPLLADSWYKFNFAKESTPQMQAIILSYYGGSWAQCVKDAFPNLQLDPKKFRSTKKKRSPKAR
eukprot:Phypoly_transcript_04905.p1 GENE.Phypoly_transcript_04905~~Phypoly_transcript_04905.p1  ORF type:complete len:657 (+),score=93.00 Phypoly_transcript_04905:87-2057(+)